MEELRRELTAALRGGQACDTIEQILSEVPAGKRYERAQGMERSPWQVLDHMRFTLEDLIVYYTNSNGQYRSPDWPDDYWPATVGSGEEWEKSLAGFNEAQGKMEELISTGDLVRPFAWEPSHSLLREAILAIEHNAYHSGELVELTRQLTTSPSA